MTKKIKELAVKLFNRIIKFILPGYHIVPNIYGVSSRKQVDIRSDPHFLKLSSLVIGEKRTLLYFDRLHTIYQSLIEANKAANSANSIFTALEVGVYKGGGSKFICETINSLDINKKIFYSVDTFSGHAAEDVKNRSDGWHKVGTFCDTSFESVSEYLSTYAFVKVFKNRIQDCFDEIVIEANMLWFVHVDVDIEIPTVYLLDKLKHCLGVGGVVVVDDFGYVSCPGMRESVKKFIAENANFCGFELQTGQAILIKTK